MSADKLKELMGKWVLSQTEIARLFGVKDSAISCLLNGKYRKVPKYLQESFKFFELIPDKKKELLIFEARKREARAN